MSLPIELVNNILSFRHRHPVAKVFVDYMNNFIKQQDYDYYADEESGGYDCFSRFWLDLGGFSLNSVSYLLLDAPDGDERLHLYNHNVINDYRVMIELYSC